MMKWETRLLPLYPQGKLPRLRFPFQLKQKKGFCGLAGTHHQRFTGGNRNEGGIAGL
jgi:hypothetical protein